jgi:chromosome partitioning protein
MGRIICVGNPKGGVGKTTTTLSLGTAFALAEKKTLLLDLDPQGHMTSGMGIDKKKINRCIYDVFRNDAELSDLIWDSEIDFLKIIPSHSKINSKIFHENREKENLLKDFLKRQKENYDYILIDCPPSIEFLTLSAMNASDSILIPLQCEYYAVESLGWLLKTYRRLKKYLNPDIIIEGILLTMVDENEEVTIQIANETRKNFNEIVFKTVIPRSQDLRESACYGMPILLQDITCKGAQSYLSLAREIIGRNGSIYSKGVSQ